MIEFIAHNLAPIMFLSLIAFLLLGYPVAFSLAANGLLFFVIAVELSPYSNEIALDWPLLQTLPGRVLDVMRNDTLLAIPFFTFMGIILEKSGMAEDLLDTIGQLFGPIRGGLAYAVILVGALLAATTGVVAASVIAMGLISLPIMLRYGYDRPLATGVIAASGTLAQIIPPSLVLIVLADQLGRSVGDMYAGAIIPGLMLAGLYCAYVFCRLDRLAAEGSGPAAGGAHPEGKSGRLLLAILAGTLVIGLAAYWLLARQMETGAGIWAATIAAVATYLFALADKHLKLGRLSHLAQQVVIVLVPPLAPDLPRAGHDLPRHRHAHRGRRHGGGRRTAHGHCQAAPQLQAAQRCARCHHPAVLLRALHPDRQPHLLAHLLWHQRPCLGRGALPQRARRRHGVS